jgi:hypothetical protein
MLTTTTYYSELLTAEHEPVIALRVAPFNVAFSRFATDTPFLLALDRNSLRTVLNDLFGGCRENSMVGSRFDLHLSSA